MDDQIVCDTMCKDSKDKGANRLTKHQLSYNQHYVVSQNSTMYIISDIVSKTKPKKKIIESM